ncbi:MAG: DoxX family protein [Pseudomonadota bacterium]
MSSSFELPEAQVVVRILCGVFLLPHTVAKLSHVSRAAEFFEKVGLRPAPFFVVVTAVMETVAAISLIFDIYRNIGALIAASILFVACWAQLKINGANWRWQFKGAEYMLFWGLTTLAVGFL